MNGIIIVCCILCIVVIFIIVGLIKGVIPEKQEPKLGLFHKKDFDDKWETINSWCVKYCDKEFPKYHDEKFLDKSEIYYDPYSVGWMGMRYLELHYNKFVRACKYPKLWEFLINAGYFNEVDIIIILFEMEDLAEYSVWKTPSVYDFFEVEEYDSFVSTEEIRVLEKRVGVDGYFQYKIKDEFLGD